MFDNMTGFVGLAMQGDRLAQAKRNARLAEAARTGSPRDERNRFCRAAIAAGLIALATRLAPNTARAATVS